MRLRKTWLMRAALVSFLLALPLIAWGAARDAPALWGAGLALLALAGLLPPATRLVPDEEAEEDDDDEADEAKGWRDVGRSRPGGPAPAPASGRPPARARLQREKAREALGRERRKDR